MSMEEFKIRQVTQIEEMEAVYRLTHDCYVSKGYAPAQKNGLLLHYPEYDVLPETTVLYAVQDDVVVGSISFTLSGREGLTICHDFLDECRAIEKEGRVISAVWRLAVIDSCRTSRQVVFGLMSEMARYTMRSKVNTWLLVVNPCHERVYQRLFNCRVVARKESTGELFNAPAVLMRFDWETMPEEWKVAEAAIYAHEPLGLATLECFLDPLSELSLPTSFIDDYSSDLSGLTGANDTRQTLSVYNVEESHELIPTSPLESSASK